MSPVIITKHKSTKFSEERISKTGRHAENQNDTNQSLFVENEIKFLVPVKALKRAVDLKQLDKDLIEQRYFSNNLIPHVLKYMQRLGQHDLSCFEARHFTQARMRKTIELSSGSESYELALKSKRNFKLFSERGEIPQEISKTKYKDILRFIRAGSAYRERGFLEKERSKDAAETKSGKIVNLEIDIIKAAGIGNHFEEYRLSDFPYVQIGCEVKDARAIQELIRGNHDIPYLKGEDVWLITNNTDLAPLLSMREISKKGLKTGKLYSLLAVAA